MANSNLTVFPTPAQASQTVQTPPQEVTQGDLSYILATRLEVERLDKLLTDAEASVKDRLKAGATVEPGAKRELARSGRTPCQPCVWPWAR